MFFVNANTILKQAKGAITPIVFQFWNTITSLWEDETTNWEDK